MARECDSMAPMGNAELITYAAGPAWLQFSRAATARFPNRTGKDRRGT